MKRAVSKALRPLKEALWAPKEGDEAEEGAAGEEEGEKVILSLRCETPARV